MIYGNQETVDRYINNLNKLKDIDLLKELKLVNNLILLNEKLRSEAKSDITYWSCVSDIEEFEEIKRYIVNQILNILRETNTVFNDIELGNVELSKVYQRTIETKKELNLYKPTNYKRMLEVITKVIGKV